MLTPQTPHWMCREMWTILNIKLSNIHEHVNVTQAEHIIMVNDVSSNSVHDVSSNSPGISPRPSNLNTHQVPKHQQLYINPHILKSLSNDGPSYTCGYRWYTHTYVYCQTYITCTWHSHEGRSCWNGKFTAKVCDVSSKSPGISQVPVIKYLSLLLWRHQFWHPIPRMNSPHTPLKLSSIIIVDNIKSQTKKLN